jgi:hypothetical protein
VQAGRPGAINAGTFKAHIQQFISKTNLPVLFTFSAPPEADEVQSVMAQRPTFIRQLELIDATDEQRMRSVGDYLRASADKTHWADAGLIFPDALSEWDTTLKNRQASIRDEVFLTSSSLDAKKQGQLVYAKCRQVQPPLDGRAVADHFVHGSFHDLSDRREIGWHADFNVLLDED